MNKIRVGHAFFSHSVAIQMELKKQQKKDKEKSTGEKEGNVDTDLTENTCEDQTGVDLEVTKGEENEEDAGDDGVDECDNDNDKSTNKQIDGGGS